MIDDFNEELPEIKDPNSDQIIPAMEGPLYDFAHVLFISKIEDY